MSDLIIRLATHKDIEVVSRLWESMVLEKSPENKPDRNGFETQISNLFNLGTYYIVVAEIKNNIVGFIDGMHYDEPETGRHQSIAPHLYVTPGMRGTDVAFRLMRYILELVREYKVTEIEFPCYVSDADFWIKKGFTIKRLLMSREVQYG